MSAFVVENTYWSHFRAVLIQIKGCFQQTDRFQFVRSLHSICEQLQKTSWAIFDQMSQNVLACRTQFWHYVKESRTCFRYISTFDSNLESFWSKAFLEEARGFVSGILRKLRGFDVYVTVSSRLLTISGSTAAFFISLLEETRMATRADARVSTSTNPLQKWLWKFLSFIRTWIS